MPQIRSKSGNERLRNTKTFILLKFSWLLLPLFPNKACCAMTLKLSCTDRKKHFNNRRHPDSVLHLEALLFSTGFWKNRHRVGKFSTRFPFSLRTLFCLFQTYTSDLCWVCKSRTGKLQTTQAKLTISPRTGEAKFHWVMEKIESRGLTMLLQRGSIEDYYSSSSNLRLSDSSKVLYFHQS